ncbi:agmatinase [Sulfodiicoccus acidiphilus]|uniref:Agmatinase n=1 Tax=Sulfodiicoccus acidiphilus TaxID=1670455 RepID=A0A348B0T4_9CREN|nr:agmatinase [Sulfodiicoccus acidiphilus]BBD71786.1 agmatinase [Sulfodiicoccus acidiphilus]GGT99186.1 agmatinase [Sulfodiicoccus acidiphilus]
MDESALLYVNEGSRLFAGSRRHTSKFAVMGIPMDITSSYRPGSRFAPGAIREAAQFIEFYSIRTGVDVSEFGFDDVGDVILHPSDVELNLRRIRDAATYVLNKGKFLISIGGEHTITTGIVSAMSPEETCVLSFDAHLDLRDEYMGYRYDHACVMRRISELGFKIMEVGNRAVGKDEIEYANTAGIPFITSHQVKLLGPREVSRKVLTHFNGCRNVYVSLDMDAIDPAYAPGVATPEPEGLDPSTILDIMNLIVDQRTVGFDVVEVSPPFDHSGITAILGAKMIFEVAAAVKSKLP